MAFPKKKAKPKKRAVGGKKPGGGGMRDVLASHIRTKKFGKPVY